MQVLRLTESAISQAGREGREIRIEGEVDLAVVSALQEAIERAPASYVLIDLEACEFIDTTTIATVLLADQNGHRVLLHSPAGQVLRVLEITGLTANGFVYTSRAEALASLTE